MKTRFERMFAKLKATAKSPSDRILIVLFEKHRQAVSEHYESCVPALDGSDFWKYTPTKDYPLNHFHGPLFHKGFRQHDITGNANADMQIWHLLSGMSDVPQSEAFWEAHEFSMKTRAALKGEQPVEPSGTERGNAA